MSEPKNLPSIEWRWGMISLHEGSVTTQEQARDLVEVINYFAERLPPGVNLALEKLRGER